jgi:hypothetical protein
VCPRFRQAGAVRGRRLLEVTADPTFQDALAETSDRTRHLLVGNGFSISANPIFRYPSLKSIACDNDRRLIDIFARFNTDNFEEAMAHATDKERTLLRDGLFGALHRVHPQRSPGLTAEMMAACALFLSNFLRSSRARNRGHIFTTNYDLLLYWVLVQHKDKLSCPDGFIGNGDFLDRKTSVSYLHGAVHIHSTGRTRRQVAKTLIGNSVDNLPNILRRNFESGKRPIVVTEGSHKEKLSEINANQYLKTCLDRFEKVCLEVNSALFMFGHCLGKSDFHLSNRIGQGNIPLVYASVHSDEDRERFMELSNHWASIRRREKLPPVEVRVFSDAEANVWGSQSRDQPGP